MLHTYHLIQQVLKFIDHPSYVPSHDKTNKMTVHQAKTQISLGIHPVWSKSSLPTWRKLGCLAAY